MTEWKDVLQLVVSTLGGEAGDCILEFLKVLPEEVTEGRKINLSVRCMESFPRIVFSRPKLTGCRKTSLIVEQQSY